MILMIFSATKVFQACPREGASEFSPQIGPITKSFKRAPVRGHPPLEMGDLVAFVFQACPREGASQGPPAPVCSPKGFKRAPVRGHPRGWNRLQ